MGNILTGTAITDIELPVGKDMTGYFARTSGSTGIHDDLKIRSVIFDDGLTKILLVVCDLLGLDSSFVKETSALIEAETDIPADNITIACIHTHSGPASIFLQDCGEVDRQWMQRLKTDILRCAKRAAEKLRPSLLEYGTGVCDIGRNRVVDENDSGTALRDMQFGMLAIRDAGSRRISTVMLNYACHPVVLDAENLLYSKDYPHYVGKYLEEKLGAEVNIIFVNGCCGDINPAERGDFSVADRIGFTLAESISKNNTVTIGEEDFSNMFFEIENFSIDIPLSHKLDVHTVNEMKMNYEEKFTKLTGSGKTDEARLQKAYFKWADSMLERLRLSTLEDSVNACIRLIRMGKLVIVTLPFEVFHDIGLRIKQYFGFENTIIICYANGDYGYLPSKVLYEKASYEAGTAYKFYGYPGPVCSDAEDIICRAILR